MYTRCPHCLTVFMVAAEQLKAARGNVRCGTCLESFDAIPHLSDGPVKIRAAPPVGNADVDAGFSDEPAHASSDTRIASEKLSSTLDAALAAASADNAAELAHDRAPAVESDERTFARKDDERATHEPADDDAVSATAAPEDRKSNTQRRASVTREPVSGPEAQVPEVLRVDAEAFTAQTAARRRAIGYGVAALVLVVLLAGQYVFFMPEDAARRYPPFRSAIESVCAQVGCMLSERRDPSRIRVVSRDVRVHPRYEAVMQIKATLTNTAPYRQPYPQVQFTLFNVNGQTIATRIFEPSEYLGRPVATSARLRPKSPFQIELDVLAPGEAAVSFEFQFL